MYKNLFLLLSIVTFSHLFADEQLERLQFGENIEHPKSFTHFVLTNEVFDAQTVDQKITDDMYVKEYSLLKSIAQCRGENPAECRKAQFEDYKKKVMEKQPELSQLTAMPDAELELLNNMLNELVEQHKEEALKKLQEFRESKQ